MPQQNLAREAEKNLNFVLFFCVNKKKTVKSWDAIHRANVGKLKIMGSPETT
jgi:hypothetical protein